jgi:hypothetical protein
MNQAVRLFAGPLFLFLWWKGVFIGGFQEIECFCVAFLW